MGKKLKAAVIFYYTSVSRPAYKIMGSKGIKANRKYSCYPECT